ncbi:MAG: protein BatD [Sedimentisphaerales bacterium]|nr:protein BatD [Sedimentisphaerales bacterium]
MKVLIKCFFIFFAYTIFLSGNAFAQVRVSAQVDSSTDIYVGKEFSYQIVIEGTGSIGQPDMSSIQQYNPRGPSTSRQSINTNGALRSFVVLGYNLTAVKEGEIQLPPVTVPVDGKKYQTNPVRINVVKPGTTDRLDLEVELSEKQCYVGQPVIMTVKFYVMADIGDFNFNIPAFTSDDFYIENPDTVNPQARDFNLGNGIIASVSQYRTTHNNREAILVTFSKVLIPKHSGVINIGPTSVSADVAVGRARSSDIFGDFFGSNVQYQRFMVSSKPLELKVLSLPGQGKPDSFYGLIGNYSIESSATPTEVSVGDPITLNIKIGGNKYLKPIQWPKLEQIPEFDKNFKIPSEQASPVLENGYKVFTQTIRANNDKVTEIPSIPLAYFDADKGTYVTAKTKPIKLEVSPTKILTGSDLLGTDFSPVNKEIEAVKQGLSANYQDMDALQSHDFSPIAAIVSPGYLVLWASPLAFLLFSAFTKIYNNTSPEKQLQKQRRGASGKAISQLKSLSLSGSPEHIEQLARVLKQYIGDRFNKTAGSLTSNDCYEAIVHASGDTETAQQFKNIIADCEASRYASTGANIDSECVNKAIDLILTIEKKSDK